MKKRLLSVFLILILAVCFTGCGEFYDPNASGNGKDSSQSGSSSSGGSSSGSNAEEEIPYTVQLMLDGKPYKPEVAINALWNNGVSIHSAPVGKDGVARIYGLDGDYRVTIDNMPKYCSYDPNVYTATADSRNVNVELIRYGNSAGSGTDLYNNITNLSTPAIYRATIKKKGQVVYFQYKPTQSGLYSIESVVDTVANSVNPIMDIYSGNHAFKVFNKSVDGGGVSSTFTKNFYYDWNIDAAEIGGVFPFAVRVESRDGIYPIYVDFLFKRDGDFERDYGTYEEVEVNVELKNYPQEEGSFVYAGDLNAERILTNDLFKLNPEDGIYYLYNADTDTYVKKLWMVIGTDSPVLGTESGTGFLDEKVSCKCAGKNYKSMLKAYAAYGTRYPVTAQLKQFLTDYASAQMLFKDGNGWAETEAGYQSDEESMWLFNCGLFGGLNGY